MLTCSDRLKLICLESKMCSNELEGLGMDTSVLKRRSHVFCLLLLSLVSLGRDKMAGLPKWLKSSLIVYAVFYISYEIMTLYFVF